MTVSHLIELNMGPRLDPTRRRFPEVNRNASVYCPSSAIAVATTICFPIFGSYQRCFNGGNCVFFCRAVACLKTCFCDDGTVEDCNIENILGRNQISRLFKSWKTPL